MGVKPHPLLYKLKKKIEYYEENSFRYGNYGKYNVCFLWFCNRFCIRQCG